MVPSHLRANRLVSEVDLEKFGYLQESTNPLQVYPSAPRLKLCKLATSYMYLGPRTSYAWVCRRSGHHVTSYWMITSMSRFLTENHVFRAQVPMKTKWNYNFHYLEANWGQLIKIFQLRRSSLISSLRRSRQVNFILSDDNNTGLGRKCVGKA